MCGIELFDSAGRPITVADPVASVRAGQASVGQAEGPAGDPRTPDKLLDGVYHTTDDLHSWLSPFDPACGARVSVVLDSAATLGALRLWNYNKSRIHSFRGAREMTVTLDGALIFAGEVRKAPGGLPEAPAAAEVILFCEDEAFLSNLDAYDAVRLPARRCCSGARRLCPPI